MFSQEEDTRIADIYRECEDGRLGAEKKNEKFDLGNTNYKYFMINN